MRVIVVKREMLFMLLDGLWTVFLLHLLTTVDCLAEKQGNENHHQGCKLEGMHPLLIVTYKNLTISADKITLPHGSRVSVRCRELGRYKLMGDPLLQCRNGTWNGKLPSCVPTTAISNYTEDVPPTILFGLPAGSAAVEPSGTLAVFPGSILHLECLFARRLGNPEWTWTSNRQYLTGWAIASTERDWKYRLSIYYAKSQDSGNYVCSTPRGLANSIRVHVVDIHCPTIEQPVAPLSGKIEGARMGQSATFKCPEGYRLQGAPNITCQYNGLWSAAVPRCEPILCPELVPTNAKLQLLERNNSHGGRVVFTCMWGYRLSGPQSIQCEGEGVWTNSMPTCEEITCPIPTSPKSGHIVEHKRSTKKRNLRYKVGALVQFACQPGHQLVGESSAICTEGGSWSHPTPICKVRCPYPGDPPHGRIAPLKFWYEPGDNIQVTCSPGYVTPLEPVKRPTCRENGIWSGPPPPCRSYKDV
ncbi:locomotion-related protein Hikaru genki isoform X1 [Neodiprion virginianus]|uniref:locomotion-related protein Hikaru genki isoform X1 n=1 Tax=Neodiprion fabricii TaxID=2872261 RepID=UPI001ED91B91|nr:locomotion-related protein Hikaru genki isoform X1 [Neodiprion fabricii]XP_046628023.1 locomotion-related protein Hikaru genki isoform X1 [Neodiprion virginianus]